MTPVLNLYGIFIQKWSSFVNMNSDFWPACRFYHFFPWRRLVSTRAEILGVFYYNMSSKNKNFFYILIVVDIRFLPIHVTLDGTCTDNLCYRPILSFIMFSFSCSGEKGAMFSFWKEITEFRFWFTNFSFSQKVHQPKCELQEMGAQKMDMIFDLAVT